MEILKLKNGEKPDGYLMRGYPMMVTKAYYPALKDKATILEEPSLAFIGWEDSRNWYGNFATGFGFYGLRFPKKYARELTAKDRAKYKKLVIAHSNGLTVRNYV